MPFDGSTLCYSFTFPLFCISVTQNPNYLRNGAHSPSVAGHQNAETHPARQKSHLLVEKHGKHKLVGLLRQVGEEQDVIGRILRELLGETGAHYPGYPTGMPGTALCSPPSSLSHMSPNVTHFPQPASPQTAETFHTGHGVPVPSAPGQCPSAHTPRGCRPQLGLTPTPLTQTSMQANSSLSQGASAHTKLNSSATSPDLRAHCASSTSIPRLCL